jgi:hypothetical protein
MEDRFAWRKKRITIKFEDLSPEAQRIIANPDYPKLSKYPDMLESKNFDGLSNQERNRILDEAMKIVQSNPNIKSLRSSKKLANFLFIFNTLLVLGVRSNFAAGALNVIGFFHLLNRQIFIIKLQKLHESLNKTLRDGGLFNPTVEGNYPKGWINPEVVSATHPVFFVKGNGDIVFIPKNKAIEYYRMLFQEKIPGKLGLTAWRWRSYLEKPTRRVKVKESMMEKIKQRIKTIVPRPARQIVNFARRNKRP